MASTRAQGMARRRSNGWIAHSLRRRKHSDQSPINPCLKHTLFLANFFFMMFFLALVISSTYVLVDKDKKVKSVVDFLFDPACLLCLVTSIAFVISFFGCGGGLRENTCFLKTYYFILSILFFLEIILIIFVFVFFFSEDSFANMGDFEGYFEDLVKDYNPNNTEADSDVRGTFDNIQEILSCCGASNNEEGYKNWEENKYFTCDESNTSPWRCSVPFSCCKIEEGGTDKYLCGQGKLNRFADTSTIYVDGCLKGLKDFIQDNIWYIGGILLGLLLPQIIFICLARTLVGQIEEQKSKW